MIDKDPRANNYYTNQSGRSATNCPIDIRKIWTWLRDPAAGHVDGTIRRSGGVRQSLGEAVLRGGPPCGVSVLSPTAPLMFRS